MQAIFIILGGSLGLAGIVAGMVYLLNYLNSIDSFGTPYLAPYSPRIEDDLKDGLLTHSVLDFKKRPKSFSPNKENRV